MDRNLLFNSTYNESIANTIDDLLSKNLSATKGLIRAYIEGRHKIIIDNISYYKRKSMKRMCIDENGSYTKLENYVYLLKDIYIESYISIIMEESHFHSIFICLSSWVGLFLGMKKNNISLDATFLVGKHGGECFAAIFSDSDNHLYTLSKIKIYITAIGVYPTEKI